MAALDTNVLVRFLVEDDPSRLAAAKKLFVRSVASGESLFVPVTVSLELEWVMRSRFGFSKNEVIHTLSQLLCTVELSFESEGAIEAALQHYGQGSADYADCLHVALSGKAGEQPMWTFDKAAAKVGGARLLAG